MDEDCIIVFLTAYDEFSYAKRAIVIRALDYLLKPCDEEELTAVMEEAMRLTDKAVENKKNSSGSGGRKDRGRKGSGKKGKSNGPGTRMQSRRKTRETERVNQVAEKIRTYIRENYMNEISMQDAARQFNYSDAYFCKLFKQCFDQNFTTYLTNFRINEAETTVKKTENISVKVQDMKVG